jgi:hypothetical protein
MELFISLGDWGSGGVFYEVCLAMTMDVCNDASYALLLVFFAEVRVSAVQWRLLEFATIIHLANLVFILQKIIVILPKS